MPLCGAIWSTPYAETRSFPAHALLQFFCNHARLSPSGQYQWWAVDGGSVEYVRRLEHYLRGRGVAIRTGASVHSVTYGRNQNVVHSAAGPRAPFEQVIFACRLDQALRLIACSTLQ